MERIKAGSKAIARVKMDPDKTVTVRMKTKEITTEASPIERIRPEATRIYSGGLIKDPKTGMFWKDGEFYKLADGCYFKAWPDGHLKDQRTETHVCWFGKVTRSSTEETKIRISRAIQLQMMKCFPEVFYDLDTGERRVFNEDGSYYEHKLV